MSASLASAKRRRAGNPQAVSQTTNAETPPPQQQPTVQRGRMSLPQLLNSIDTRLKKLEQDAKNEPPQVEKQQETSFKVTDPESGETRTMTIPEYMADMDKKFFMLAEEITSMKDIVLKLQSFTMEVNKTLMEERVKILSDMPEVLSIDNEDNEEDENITMSNE